MSPFSPPRGPKPDHREVGHGGYDSYRPPTQRSLSRGRQPEQDRRSPARSVARSRSRPPIKSTSPQSPHHPKFESSATLASTVPPDASRSSADTREIQTILTALFDASNQIAGVRINAEAAAKNVTAAQKSFDNLKPGQHSSDTFEYFAKPLETAKNNYSVLASEYQTLLHKHGDAITRLSQLLQPQPPPVVPVVRQSDMEELEQRIMIGFHDQLESHKQSVRREMDERDRKLMRDVDARICQMQSKMDADLRKLVNDRLRQDIHQQVSPAKDAIAALKIEVDNLRKRQDFEESNRTALVAKNSEESAVALSTLASLKSRLDSLEGAQANVATLREDASLAKETTESLLLSMDSIKLELAANQGRLVNQADRADALEGDVQSLQNEITSLREKTTATPTNIDLHLAPLLSDLDLLKTRLTGLESQAKAPTSNQSVDSQQQLARRDYNAVIEQPQRHELQSPRNQAVQESNPEQPVMIADPVPTARSPASGLENLRNQMDQRLRSLHGKVEELGIHYAFLQERYDSTTTQQLHDAIVETMKRTQPFNELSMALNDVHVNLQLNLQAMHHRIGMLEARPATIVERNPADTAKERWAATEGRLSRLEFRENQNMNMEKRLEDVREAFFENIKRLEALVTTKDNRVRDLLRHQFTSLMRDLTAKSDSLSALEAKVEDIATTIGNMDQSRNVPTANAMPEEVVQNAMAQMHSRWNEISTSLRQQESTFLSRLDTTNSQLQKLHARLGDEDDHRSSDSRLEPTTMNGLIKWLISRHTSLEGTLHTSLADGQNSPENWHDCHAQIREGLLLRDEVLDSHNRILSLGSKSLAVRASTNSHGPPRKVFQKAGSLPGTSPLLRIKRSSFETGTSDSSHPFSEPSSSGGPVQTPQGNPSHFKRKWDGSGETQDASETGSVLKSESTLVRRSPGRPRKTTRLANGTTSDTPVHRATSPEAPVSPPGTIDLTV